jgi:hypothetical protein
MKKILLRASKTPFDIFSKEPIQKQHLLKTYASMGKSGTKNVGNLVFAHSVYKALSTPGNVIAIDDYELSLNSAFAAEAGRINEEYDAFVIPLCNAFRKSYRETLVRMTDTIRQLRIPCVVTGVGAQFPLGESFDELAGIKDEVYNFVASILDRSHSLGVRGPITQDYLVSIGFPRDRIEVIGCPSMFYNGANMSINKPEQIDRVAISLSSIGHKNILNFTNYFNEHPDNVTYIPQVRALMPAIAKGRLPTEGEQNSTESPMPNLLREGKIAFLSDVLPWINFMKTQSFAIGTRIHGNIVPLLAGTPSHVIVHDSRTLELADYFEIPRTLLSEMRHFDLQETFEKSDYTALQRNHPQRLRTYANFLEKNGLGHTLYDPESQAVYDAKARDALTNARLDHLPPKKKKPAKQALPKPVPPKSLVGKLVTWLTK